MDGAQRQRAACPVDPADPPFDVSLEVSMRIDFAERWHRHLDEANLVTQRRRARQKAFDGLEPSRNSLGVVESVNTKHDPAAAGISSNIPDARINFRINGQCSQPFGIHPHRKHSEVDLPVGDAHTIDVRLNASTCSSDATKWRR